MKSNLVLWLFHTFQLFGMIKDLNEHISTDKIVIGWNKEPNYTVLSVLVLHSQLSENSIQHNVRVIAEVPINAEKILFFV